MSDTNTDAPAAPVVNYEAIFTEYSWWTTRNKARQFVIVRVHHDFPDTEPCNVVPTAIELLELHKSSPTLLTWEEMISKFNADLLIKIIIH